VVAQAQGDAQRFRSVYAEYQKAPQVMRDRMYLDAMQQIYSNVTKVMVESRQGGSLLYLPLDKLLQQAGTFPGPAEGLSAGASSTAANTSSAAIPSPSTSSGADARSRDASRTRERDVR
jgi:membrane protease subunit HflK